MTIAESNFWKMQCLSHSQMVRPCEMLNNRTCNESDPKYSRLATENADIKFLPKREI